MRIIDRYSIQVGAKMTFQEMFACCERFLTDNQLSSSGLFWHIRGGGAAKSLSLFPELAVGAEIRYTPAGDIHAVSTFSGNPPCFAHHDQAIRTLIGKVPRGLRGCDAVHAGFYQIAFFPEAAAADNEFYPFPSFMDIPALSALQFSYDSVFPSERKIILTIDVTGSDPAHPLDSSAYGQSLQGIVGKSFRFKRSVLLSKQEQQKYDVLTSSLDELCAAIHALCADPCNSLVRMGTEWKKRHQANRALMVQYARLGQEVPEGFLKAPVFSLAKPLTSALKPLGFQKLSYQASVFTFRRVDPYGHATVLTLDISPRHKTISAAIDLSGLGFSHRFALPEYQPVDQTDAQAWCQALAEYLSGTLGESLHALSQQYPPSPAWLYSQRDFD